MNQSYETTLLGVKNYSVAAQLPFHYILLDSWWYYRGNSGNVERWDMRPTVFPRGLGHFASATGWSPPAQYAPAPAAEKQSSLNSTTSDDATARSTSQD